ADRRAHRQHLDALAIELQLGRLLLLRFVLLRVIHGGSSASARGCAFAGDLVSCRTGRDHVAIRMTRTAAHVADPRALVDDRIPWRSPPGPAPRTRTRPTSPASSKRPS